MKPSSVRCLVFFLLSALFAQSSFAADLTLPQGGKVSIELIGSEASYSNTLSVDFPSSTPNAVVAVNGCRLEEPADPNLPGVRLMSEKLALRGCRVTLDADGTVEGIQPFADHTVLRFYMCAQTSPGPPCEYIWSSNAGANPDGFDHVRTDRRSEAAYPGRIFQLNWEDLPDTGDRDFNDLVATVRVDIDRDGDGLWDDWETSGIDSNGDGLPDLILPGADPDHKNIYVEIDWMDCAVPGGDCTDTHSHRPNPAAIEEVIEAFAQANVTNPDGFGGINLHIDVNNAIPHRQFLVMPDGCFAGTPGTGFDAIKGNESNFGPQNPRRFAYHYGLFTHRQTPDDFGASGCAERPGNDFQVALGDWENQTGTVMQQAGTLMHELGHNLGLRHGGGDAADFKPNYLSVMNHHYQMTGILPTSSLDFSRIALLDLNQTDLHEPSGVGDGSDTVFYFATPVGDDIGVAIDGHGSDSAWASAPIRMLTGLPLTGTAKLQRSNDAVYLLVTVNDSTPDSGGSSSPGDTVRIFVSPPSGPATEFRVVRTTIATRHTKLTGGGPETPWNPGSNVLGLTGTGNVDMNWTVEVRLTAAELGLANLPSNLRIGIRADDYLNSNLAVWPPLFDDLDAGTWHSLNLCPNGSVQSASGSGPVDWNCNGVATDTCVQGTCVQGDINNDGACVLAGPNGILDTVAVGDDIKAGDTIWNGPNLTCDTPRSGDDVQKLAVGGVEPNPLTGYWDWTNVQYDFQSTASFEEGFRLPLDEAELDRPRYLQHVAADLELSMTAAPTRVKSGSNVTYTLTVRNKKPGAAQNVLLTGVLPPTTSFVSCAASAGGVCGGTSGSPTVFFSAIPGGGTATVTLVARVSCDMPDGTPIGSTASVDFSGADPDPDPSDNAAAITVVVDNPPPAIENARLNRSMLWPPNHKMVGVLASYLVRDNCGVPVCALSVSSNEPINGLGDGDTAPDWRIFNANRFQLRAERAGTGTGRVYTTTIQCRDSAGGTSARSLAVEVPKNRGKSQSRPDRRRVPKK